MDHDGDPVQPELIRPAYRNSTFPPPKSALIENPIYMDHDGDSMKPEWLRPADRLSDSTGSPPKSVLVETLAFIDEEQNTTTGHATRSDGEAIHVTFWIAHPPRVSYFTVYCPGREPDEYPFIPQILAMDDDAALIRVPIFGGEDPSDQSRKEFFIYRAGIGNSGSRLHRLPDPETKSFADKEIGLLRCRTEDSFFVVALGPAALLYTDRHKRYLHLFDSKTWKWDTFLLHIESPESCLYAITHKVIKVGGNGGSIAWVDLWHGILVYDVLLGKDVLRYIPLPSPVLPDPQGVPRSIRDMATINGHIRYFSMYRPGIQSTYLSGDWEANSWKMNYPSETWQPDCKFKVSDIMVDHQRHSGLLPDLPGDIAEEAVLRRLYAGNPILDLHEDDVVYILTKIQHHDHRARVLAVNIRTKTLQGGAEFYAGRAIGFNFVYTQSEISKYMGTVLKIDHDQSDASWTSASSTKKRSGPPAGTGMAGSLPGRVGIPLGVVQRGEHLGLNNGQGSDVAGRDRGGWPRQQNGAGRGGVPLHVVQRGDNMGLINERRSDVPSAGMSGRGGGGQWPMQQNGAERGGGGGQWPMQQNGAGRGGGGGWPRQQNGVGRGGVPLRVVQRGDNMGLINEWQVPSAGMSGRGGGGQWLRPQNGAQRGGQPLGTVQREHMGLNNELSSDVSGSGIGGRGGSGPRQQNGAQRGWQVRRGRT